MTKEEAKRFAEVLLAYSRGEPVQTRIKGAWVTCKSGLDFDSYSSYYRLPPPTLSYRNWLYKDRNCSKVGVVFETRPEVFDCDSFARVTGCFVRWLGDWQEVEL